MSHIDLPRIGNIFGLIGATGLEIDLSKEENCADREGKGGERSFFRGRGFRGRKLALLTEWPFHRGNSFNTRKYSNEEP